ncbi:fatty acid desaturase [Microbaculum marinum]|uniref:Fatty acid desaturase n=1 Tax=Microbaculum marinum TaxID=1764581 RepID=A0AAW9RPX3_9HYPH
MSTEAVLDKDEKRFLKGLSARSDARGLERLAGHLGAIAAGAVLVWLASGTWLVWPAMFMEGVGLVFLFCALHETVHRTAFASLWMNAAVAHFAGFAVLLPPAWFRAFHLAHHRHTQIPGEDPELDDKRVDSWPRYAWHVSGLKYWTSAIRALVMHALGRVPDRYVTQGLKPRVVAEARWFLAGYAVLAAGSLLLGTDVLLRYWVVPMVLSQPVLRLYLLAEHGLCPFIGDPFANTRTTITTRAVRFLAWNMPYHTEHHAFMGVPFHALPQVHERFASRLKEVENGYSAFNVRYVKEAVAPRG